MAERLSLRSLCLVAPLVVAVCLIFLPPGAGAAEEPTTRESELVVAPADAWRETGFRLQLRSGWEYVIGFGTVPGSWGVPVAVEPSVRLSSHWSLTSSLQYTLLSGAHLRGLRFAAGLGAAWHPWEGLQLGAGLGYTGALADWSQPPSGTAFVPRQGYCDGQGALVNVRLAYLFAVGELFATGPVLQTETLGIKCQPIIENAAEGGSPVAVPWWWQQTLSASWAFAWR